MAMEGSSGAAVEGLNPNCASLGETAIAAAPWGPESGGTAGCAEAGEAACAGGGKAAVCVAAGAAGASSRGGAASGACGAGAASWGAAWAAAGGVALAVWAGCGATGSGSAAGGGTALAGGGGGAGTSVPARKASALYCAWVPAAARESATFFSLSGVVATLGLSGKVERSGAVPEPLLLLLLPESSLKRPVGSSDAMVEQAPALMARASTAARRKPFRIAGRIALFVMPSNPTPQSRGRSLTRRTSIEPGETRT